jgi:class 3 adenylate cyclase
MCDRELIAELPHVLGRRGRSLPRSIYPALEALEAEGLIEAEDDGDEIGYHLTLAGDAARQDHGEAGILDRAGRAHRRPAFVARAEGDQSDQVTILFTDLVGSTAWFDRIGDEAAHKLRRHHFAMLRGAVADHHGVEVKSLGDGLMVVFSSAAAAISCAVAMQSAARRCEDPVGLRIGIEAGEPVREGADFFGRPVIVAKRLCDAAKGGQILTSESVRDLAGSDGAQAFERLGSLALKGLREPVAATVLGYAPAAESDLLRQVAG